MSSPGAERTQPAEPEPRLSRRDRVLLAGITVVALVVAAAALLSAFWATLMFFGEQASPRESAVAAHSLWVVLWALATPFCCWAVLRGGRPAVIGATIWLVVLALSRPWWWPSPPADDFDQRTQPLWLSPLPWALVGAVLVVGVIVAWRSASPNVRGAAVGALVAIVVLSGVSYANLQRHARDEEPTPLAEGRTELAALREDPIWDALPAGEVTHTREHPAVLSDWGQKFSTWRSVTLGTTQDLALFEQAVAAAESSGWILHGSFCTDGLTDGSFTKTLPLGPAYLRISVASYSPGVNVYAELAPAPGPPHPRRCWL